MKIKVDFSAILASVVVLYCNGGMLSFFKGSSLMTILIYGILFIWLVWTFIKDGEFAMEYISVCYFIIIFFVLLNIFLLILNSGVSNMMVRMRKNILFLLIFVAIFIYYSVPERKIGRRMILCLWGIDTVIASMYTIYRLVEVPTLSRILATENPEKYLGTDVSIAGVLSFGSIYGLVFIVTAIIGSVKKVKPINKIIMFGCVILFVYTIIQAQFFIASILCVLGITMSVLGNEKITLKKLILWIACLPLVAVVFYVIINDILPYLVSAGWLPNFISERLKMFLDGVSIEELSGTARGIVYLQSFEAIKESFGVGIMFIDTLRTGGHSEFLDMIAVYGIPLALLLICGMYRIKKVISLSVPADLKMNYNIVWVLFLLMSFLNTSLWCQTTVSLILMIPLVYMEVGSDITEVK